MYLNKHSKGPLGNATYQVQAFEQRGSEEVFLKIFLCISVVQA